MALAAIQAPSATRDAVLDAAEWHFAEHGFAGASVREIAAHAGLKNQASVYHYAADKRALYDAVMARAVDAILPVYAPVMPATATETAAMAASLHRLLDYLAAHPHVARLIERAGMEEPSVRDIAQRRLRPLFDAGVTALEAAGGSWTADELPHLAAGLYHLIFGYFASAPLMQAVMRGDPYSDAMLQRHRDFVIAAVARLLAPPSAPEGSPDRTPL